MKMDRTSWTYSKKKWKQRSKAFVNFKIANVKHASLSRFHIQRSRNKYGTKQTYDLNLPLVCQQLFYEHFFLGSGSGSSEEEKNPAPDLTLNRNEEKNIVYLR